MDKGKGGGLVSLVVPAHNEADNLGALFERADAAFRSLGRACELVFVDDGSTDRTWELLANFEGRYPFLRTFRHGRRLGLTRALETAFAKARGEVVVFLPADLESDPVEDLPTLVSKIEEGYDVVCGWRQGERDGKRFVSFLYNGLCRRLFGLALHDMNWIKAFRREVIEQIPLRSDWHRYVVPIASTLGFSVTEVKTLYHPRRRGVSKFSAGRLWPSVLDLLVIKFLLLFSRAPMRFFGTIGAGFLAGSLFLFLNVGLSLWTNPEARPLFRFLLASVLLLSGLLLFLVGFLAELVANRGERPRL